VRKKDGLVEKDDEENEASCFFFSLIMIYGYAYICQRAATVKGHTHTYIALYRSSEHNVDRRRRTHNTRQSLQAKQRRENEREKGEEEEEEIATCHILSFSLLVLC
jgi:hypothetical protein